MALEENGKTMSEGLALKMCEQLAGGGILLPDERLAFKGKR